MATDRSLDEVNLEEPPTALFDAVEASLRRGDVRTAMHLVASIRCRIEAEYAPTPSPAGLTQRESATLALLPDASLSQKDIARTLGVSHNTVKTHLRSLYQKLGVHSRAEAIERGGLPCAANAVGRYRHLASV
ncbi:MAG: LuxR C-terminal-related transcriptional regulator [Acidimicrobiia bacterium]|nr:LuxR C-terminal-related transcriptional regulator [Acidimicrobiia bacterium]